MSLQVKKTPTRRCTGCGEHFPKKDLVRVVREPSGNIVLDLVGKVSGRGAYICKSKECLIKARRSSRIERSLECSIPSEIWDRIEKELH
ncbi:MAG: YlxR family protein [Clostridia bacterium]|nr:YlxR family protein [Clostridia bacterium]